MASTQLKEDHGSTTTQISWVALFLSLLFLIKISRLRSKKQTSERIPPGPTKLPIIGDMIQLMGPAPHRLLADLAQKHGPIIHLKLSSVLTIVISSAELAKEIMKTHDVIFASRPKVVAARLLCYNYTNLAFAPYGPYWRQLKKICILELLTSKRVLSFRFVREEEVSLLVSSIASSPIPANMAENMFLLNNEIISRVAFGKKLKNEDGFKEALKEGVKLVAGFNIGAFFPSLEFVCAISGMKKRIEKNFVEIDRILTQIIEEHIEKNKMETEHEDLVDVLVRLQKDNNLNLPLTKDNIEAIFLDMFAGGTENTANTIEWAMAKMMRNPKIMVKAQEEVRRVVGGKEMVEKSGLHELSYTKSVVKETLRLHPPLPLLVPRESIESCMINGYNMPEKTWVIINYWAISRDTIHWKDPEKFDPERFVDGFIDFKGHNFEFIPFGAGRRGCSGLSFGVVAMVLALASLLYHFDWELPDGMKPEDLDMSEAFGVSVSKKSNLYLIPLLHNPL